MVEVVTIFSMQVTHIISRLEGLSVSIGGVYYVNVQQHWSPWMRPWCLLEVCTTSMSPWMTFWCLLEVCTTSMCSNTDHLEWYHAVYWRYLWSKIFDRHGHKTFSLIKNNILHQSKIYKNHFENSNFWRMWPLGHVGHVIYNFKIMLFISTGIFYDKPCPQSLSVVPTVNVPLSHLCEIETDYRRICHQLTYIDC